MTASLASVDRQPVSIAVPNLSLTADEQRILGQLRKQLNTARNNNRGKYNYYDTRQIVEQMNIAVPPELRDVFTVCGWPSTVVDILEERIDLLGFIAEDGNLRGLDEFAIDNALSLKASQAGVDKLIAGTAFVTMGRGLPDEPEVIFSPESPNSATVIWNHRKNRADAGLSQTFDERGRLSQQSLYLPDKTVFFRTNRENGGKLEITGIDNHGIGRPLMTRLINRDRASNPYGRSEITRPVRYYTDAAIRTMLGMEVNREFYTTPMRALLDVDPSSLGFEEGMTEAEKKARGWSLIMGHLNIVPPQGNGGPTNQPRPSIQQFQPMPPTPYLEQVKGYSIMLSGESGMPASFFGFVTDNPTSGDAIVKGEYRLIRRAERRIQSDDMTYREVALLHQLCLGRDVTARDMRAISPQWRNPAVPTRAGQADEAQKLIASEVLPPQSEVTWDRLDISKAEQRRLVIDWRKRNAEVAAKEAADNARQMATQVAISKAKAAATPAPTTGQPGRANVGGGPSA